MCDYYGEKKTHVSLQARLFIYYFVYSFMYLFLFVFLSKPVRSICIDMGILELVPISVRPNDTGYRPVVDVVDVVDVVVAISIKNIYYFMFNFFTLNAYVKFC